MYYNIFQNKNCSISEIINICKENYLPNKWIKKQNRAKIKFPFFVETAKRHWVKHRFSETVEKELAFEFLMGYTLFVIRRRGELGR